MRGVTDELFFTDHARKEMRRRRVRPGDVRNALRNQIREYSGTNLWKGTVVIRGPSMLGREIGVVVDEVDRQRIVTVFKPPRPRRRLRRRK
jgi:predicted alpha/beta-hydrolase family hydrolase